MRTCDHSLLCQCETDEARHEATRKVFESWPAGSHEKNTDSLVDLLSRKVQFVQQNALEARSRGEDTSESEKLLWKMVDMVVQVKVLMRELRAETEVDAKVDDPALEPGYSSRPNETRIRFSS